MENVQMEVGQIEEGWREERGGGGGVEGDLIWRNSFQEQC